jgi:hypothetical protein
MQNTCADNTLPMPEAFTRQGTGTSPLRVGDALVVFQQKGDQSALMASR